MFDILKKAVDILTFSFSWTEPKETHQRIRTYPHDFPNVGKPLNHKKIDLMKIPGLTKKERFILKLIDEDKVDVEAEVKAFETKFKISTKGGKRKSE